jgi:hypothetical protein
MSTRLRRCNLWILECAVASHGLPLSSTWMLEFIKLLKDECDEVGQQ